jgi:hypothetical protein
MALVSLEQWSRIFLDGNDWRYVPEPQTVQVARS